MTWTGNSWFGPFYCKLFALSKLYRKMPKIIEMSTKTWKMPKVTRQPLQAQFRIVFYTKNYLFIHGLYKKMHFLILCYILQGPTTRAFPLRVTWSREAAQRRAGVAQEAEVKPAKSNPLWWRQRKARKTKTRTKVGICKREEWKKPSVGVFSSE